MKFEVGDKVRINPETGSFRHGNNPMIQRAKEKGTLLRVSKIEGNDRIYTWFPAGIQQIFHEKELIPVVQGHSHAKAMAQYAEDAKTSEQPWELWQLQTISGQWLNCTVPVAWNPDKRYRRKPAAHVVNGFEVPAQKWQPIKTIPGNSYTRILLSDGKRIWAPDWHAAMYRDGTDASGWAGQEHATHWMPMPDLPNEG